VSAPVAMVTGASSGIGAACARRLLERGFRVFGTSRRARTPSPDADGVHWVALDVTDEDSVRRGVARVVEEAGRLDGLVCNAGFGIFGSVEEVTLEEARAQFDTNVFGVLRTLRAALPHLRRAGRGRIALVGSLAGRAPIPFQAHYSASKAAVEALALSLYNELRPTGVRVALVEPGDVNTPFNESIRWGDPEASLYGERVRACEQVVRESLPKAPGPEVVARAVERALTARWPRVRYTCGADATAVPLGRRLLPDRLALRLIRSHFRV